MSWDHMFTPVSLLPGDIIFFLKTRVEEIVTLQHDRTIKYQLALSRHGFIAVGDNVLVTLVVASNAEYQRAVWAASNARVNQ